MNIKNNDEIDELRTELKKTQEHLKKITDAFNAQAKQLANERYLSDLKNDFNAYIHRSQKLMLAFIKLLTSGKAIKLSDIPDSIKKHLNNRGISENAEKFYFLRLKKCSHQSVIVEITSAEAKMTEQIKCNKYTNLGYFSNNFAFYHQFILPSLYCYKNGTQCSQIDTKNCIQHFVS